jgi:hypothetical protein
MDRSSRRRIWKIEELLSAAKKEREEKLKKEYDNYRLHARFHATAVAAIVLSGEPKIDEPLIQAWKRALQHYGISGLQQFNLSEAARENYQVGVAQRLVPVIIGGAEESARFTEIFRTAPVWLLNFTSTFVDTIWLKFCLPSKSSRSERGSGGGYKWGSAGYEESRRWPLLPLGTMTDGDPIPEGQMPPWPLPLDLMKEIDRIPDIEEEPSQEDADDPSPEFERLEDMKLHLDLVANPEIAKELSRYERRRLLKLFASYAAGKRSGDD